MRATLCWRGVCCGCASVCLFVSLSQVGDLSKLMHGLSHSGFLELCHTLCYKEIRVSPKRRVLSSGTLSKTLVDLSEFLLRHVGCCKGTTTSVYDAAVA